MKVPVFLKDTIDFEQVSQDLAQELKTMSLSSVYDEFTRFFWDISDCDYWFYSEQQAQEHIQFLKGKFLFGGISYFPI